MSNRLSDEELDRLIDDLPEPPESSPDQLIDEIVIGLRELRERRAADQRVHAWFQRRNLDGSCACPYCTGSVEEIEAHAANLELDLFSAKTKRDEWRARAEAAEQALAQDGRRVVCCRACGGRGYMIQRASVPARDEQEPSR